MLFQENFVLCVTLIEFTPCRSILLIFPLILSSTGHVDVVVMLRILEVLISNLGRNSDHSVCIFTVTMATVMF